MVWYVEPRQKKDEMGDPSGKWRLIARSDEGGGFHECSDRDFDSWEEAVNDPESRKRANQITGMPDPEDVKLVQSAEKVKHQRVAQAAHKLIHAIYEFNHPGLTASDFASAISDRVQHLEDALLTDRDLG